MNFSNGIQWGDQYGTSTVQFDSILPDIIKHIVSGGSATAWVDNRRGKPFISTAQTDRSVAMISCVEAATADLTAEEIAELNQSNFPILRVALPSGLVGMYYPLSYKDAMPFEGRQWYPNYADCYRLVLDYYKRELWIVLPVMFTPENYVAQSRSYAGQNLFLTGWEVSGFKQVVVPRHGDALLMRTGNSAVVGPDHCGIYLDGDLILHHFINRLSTTQEYAGLWRDSTVMILRHQSRI